LEDFRPDHDTLIDGMTPHRETNRKSYMSSFMDTATRMLGFASKKDPSKEQSKQPKLRPNLMNSERPSLADNRSKESIRAVDKKTTDNSFANQMKREPEFNDNRNSFKYRAVDTENAKHLEEDKEESKSSINLPKDDSNANVKSVANQMLRSKGQVQTDSFNLNKAYNNAIADMKENRRPHENGCPYLKPKNNVIAKYIDWVIHNPPIDPKTKEQL